MALTEIGKQVKIKLIEDEMTQTELADRLGTTKQLLNNYLRGEKNTNIDAPLKEWLRGHRVIDIVKDYYDKLSGDNYIAAAYQTVDDDYVHITLVNKYHETKEVMWYKNELTSIVGKFSDWEIDYFRGLLK